VIVAVNGKKTTGMKHADVVSLLQSSTVNPTAIEVEYSLPDPRKFRDSSPFCVFSFYARRSALCLNGIVSKRLNLSLNFLTFW